MTNLSDDHHFGAHSKSLAVHAGFLDKFAELVHQSALVWHRANHRLPDIEPKATSYFFLGKHSKACCEAFRRSCEDSHNLTPKQFRSILDVCGIYIRCIDIYPDIHAEFASYNEINKVFDARSHKGRGPKIISDEQLSRYFDEMMKRSGYRVKDLVDRDAFLLFFEENVVKERLSGDYSSAIRNSRAVAWKLTQERRQHFYKLTDPLWGFYMGCTVRQGFYAAQQCEDYFNMNFFLSVGLSAERLFKEKYLMASRQYMLMHEYGLKTGLHNNWNSDYASTALKIIHSATPDGSPPDMFASQSHNRVNAVMEKIRNGDSLNATYPDLFGSRSSMRDILKGEVEYLANKSRDGYDADAIESSAITLANFAEAETIQGDYDEAKQLLLDANSLLLMDDTIRFARARVLEALGVVEIKLGHDGNPFLRKARSIYTEIGATTRAAYVHSKIK